MYDTAGNPRREDLLLSQGCGSFGHLASPDSQLNAARAYPLWSCDATRALYCSRAPCPRSCYSQESFCKLEGAIFWEAGEIPARPRHCKRGGSIQNATVHQDGKADRTGDA